LKVIIPEGEARHQMIADLGQVQALLRDSKEAEEPALRASREILAALGPGQPM